MCSSRIVAVGIVLLLVPMAHAGAGKVHGTVQYEKIPYLDAKTGTLGLQLKNPILTPVAGAKVELVLPNGAVLGSTFTDRAGTYSIPWSVAEETKVFVRVMALSKHVKVVNNKETVHGYTAKDPLTLLNEDRQQDLTATDAEDHAGPFNILEAIRRADDFLEKTQPGILAKIPACTVMWTRGDNRAISHFSARNNQAFIMGDRETDSDEFDDFIIVHEYGHFVSANFAFNDSDGGNHGRGQKLDPRLAWGEGFANFFACAVLDDPYYIDTGKVKGKQGALLFMDLDENVPAGDNPGYWSEHTVGSVLWDVMDDGRQRAGRQRHMNDLHLGVGFKEVWQIVTGPLNDRRHISIIDFCDVLVERNPKLGPKVAQLLKFRNIDYFPGKFPSVANPFHRPMEFGKEYAGTVNSVSTPFFNLDSSHFYLFKLEQKSKVKIHMKITESTTPDRADVDLYLHDKRGPVGWSNATNGVGGTETIEKILGPGVYYVQVKSYFNKKHSGSYTLKATVPGKNQDGVRRGELPDVFRVIPGISAVERFLLRSPPAGTE